jgi:HAD superfamily hydrolase (TIGR01509 family)
MAGMNPFRVRGILFDFDGVLVDSEPIRFSAGVQALAEIGESLTWDRFVKFWLGRTDEAGLRDLLGGRFEAEGRRIIERRNALYEARLDEVPGAPDALRLVQRVPEGVRLAVVTGSRRIEVEAILWRLAVSERFHVLVTAEDYGQAKPAPEPFLAAAHRLDLPPVACLVIEDSPAGVAAALAAGMPVVAKGRRPGEGQLDEATWKVSSLDDLTLRDNGEVVVKEQPSAIGR